ncbi:MarR family transcriptional regulator [Planococcus sp. APC 3906]|uniref:MarR family winged helix-turn-helix transcriptional regulator n=1 Tax=Planococcus sp. APC 3906 TaxID=3035194 RepID=UPI0025B5C7A4|nr:MarR family transcriptional regulator [Planococcus sp. APC 3906]MDN3449675.1 MarR family transcriptional regulator [Planococcus sp. APC 3906]
MKASQEFFQQFMLLYRSFEHHLNDVLGNYGLYRAQWSILHYLANNGSATLVELAQYLRVEKPTITRTISRLENIGYLSHIPGKDRREKRIEMSETGYILYAEVRIAVDALEEDILSGVSEAQQQQTTRIMKGIRHQLTSKEHTNEQK